MSVNRIVVLVVSCSTNGKENLELWVKRQPPGQRVVDRISDSIEFLKTYAPGLLDKQKVDNWKGEHI